MGRLSRHEDAWRTSARIIGSSVATSSSRRAKRSPTSSRCCSSSNARRRARERSTPLGSMRSFARSTPSRGAGASSTCRTWWRWRTKRSRCSTSSGRAGPRSMPATSRCSAGSSTTCSACSTRSSVNSTIEAARTSRWRWWRRFGERSPSRWDGHGPDAARVEAEQPGGGPAAAAAPAASPVPCPGPTPAPARTLGASCGGEAPRAVEADGPGAGRSEAVPSEGEGGERRQRTEAGSIRVDLEKLDTLMDLVGELILAGTMVTHNPDLEGHDFADFQRASLQLNRITRSIQDVAMSVRMVPISGTFRKMLRLVRDLAQKQGKLVELELAGESTEIDKTVVEAIADPLVHIVRNSVDHGLEAPSERTAAGKPATGRIRMEATHEGGEIRITIEDDGRGLDRDAILEKARSRGLIDPARGELGESEIFRFIFAPGFSTAKQVSDVSGRGVGMDVVRRNIDRLGGRVDVASTKGLGTTIQIRLPLTLAIVEGMLVRVGGSVYTIPLLAIRESVTISADRITRPGGGQEMVDIRGQLLPVLRVHAFHGIEGAQEDLEKGILVVVEDHSAGFAIFVDALVGQRQTVIKALPEYLGQLPGISGCSILANGDISLILDVKALHGEWFGGGKS
ncbi:MAG: chemotaxis protein CheA [Myxococcota bacterium]